MNSGSTGHLTSPSSGEEGGGARPAFPISPEKFWSTFSEDLRSEWADAKKHVPAFYNNGSAWTGYMTGFLKALAGRFSCIPDTERSRVDVGYFDKAGADWDEWALEVAIENQNEVTWNDDLSKLLMINAGLKVLIAYSDNREWVSGILNRFVEISKSRKYLHPNSGWLFVFGPRCLPAKQDFIAFKLDRQSIVEITGGRKIICA